MRAYSLQSKLLDAKRLFFLWHPRWSNAVTNAKTDWPWYCPKPKTALHARALDLHSQSVMRHPMLLANVLQSKPPDRFFVDWDQNSNLVNIEWGHCIINGPVANNHIK